VQFGLVNYNDGIRDIMPKKERENEEYFLFTRR
jgi:hypothetical protein